MKLSLRIFWVTEMLCNIYQVVMSDDDVFSKLQAPPFFLLLTEPVELSLLTAHDKLLMTHLSTHTLHAA